MVAYKMTEEDQDLPSPVDALVVGTAFAEAAVAAALARAGDRVLHVDRNAYYGGSGAGFSLGKLQAWAAERTERAESRADEEVCLQLTAADRAALAAEGFSDVAVVPLATRDAAVVHAAPPLPTAASLAAAAGAVDAGVDAIPVSLRKHSSSSSDSNNPRVKKNPLPRPWGKNSEPEVGPNPRKL